MKKILTVITAVLMALTMSVGAFAYKSDVFEAEPAAGFKEGDIGVEGFEGATFEPTDSMAVGTYQIYSLASNPQNYKAEDFFKNNGKEKLTKQIVDSLQKDAEDSGIDADFEVNEVKLETIGEYDGISVYVTLEYTGMGIVEMKVFMIPRQEYCVYVRAYEQTEEKTDELVKLAVSTLNITAEEPSGKTMGIVTSIIGFAILGAIIGGVSSLISKNKKKKQLRKMQLNTQQPQYPQEPQNSNNNSQNS